MANQTVPVPDIGGAENVEVIEIAVSPGDIVAVEDTLITLESDKASMDIPSPAAGKVISVLVSIGDNLSEGSAILELEESGVSSESEKNNESDNGGETSVEPEVAAAAEPEVVAAAPVASHSGGGEIPVLIPDIGGTEGIDVIEVCVAVGDSIEEGDSILVLESDKASMEVPSPASGTVTSITVKEGDKVSEGDSVLVLVSADAVGSSANPASSVSSSSDVVESVDPVETGSKNPDTASSIESKTLDVAVPDIGGSGVDVIEISVSVGDVVEDGDTLIVLESDKASMEIPSPSAGKVLSISIQEGDKVSQDSPILILEVSGGAEVASTPSASVPAPTSPPSQQSAAKSASQAAPAKSTASESAAKGSGSDVYAGPAVRKLARQLGVNLSEVKAAGPRGRISKDDVKAFVKTRLQKKPENLAAALSSGVGIPQVPEVDFSKFGDVEVVKMSKLSKMIAANMTRNWLNVPHVTQFDDADVTDLEEFRSSMKKEAEKTGVRLTPLPFLLKACAMALNQEPSFNVSLHADGEHIVRKKHVHIGIAVATPTGLVVPVIRDVDKKGLLQLAEESSVLAKKARDGKLLPKDMQGGCFTISSLGAIGGTGFTPIVNCPEVAILGVSKSTIKPFWDGEAFVPRQMLPLSLSYDHRAVNGADAGRFFTFLTTLLADVRRLSL